MGTKLARVRAVQRKRVDAGEDAPTIEIVDAKHMPSAVSDETSSLAPLIPTSRARLSNLVLCKYEEARGEQGTSSNRDQHKDATVAPA